MSFSKICDALRTVWHWLGDIRILQAGMTKITRVSREAFQFQGATHRFAAWVDRGGAFRAFIATAPLTASLGCPSRRRNRC